MCQWRVNCISFVCCIQGFQKDISIRLKAFRRRHEEQDQLQRCVGPNCLSTRGVHAVSSARPGNIFTQSTHCDTQACRSASRTYTWCDVHLMRRSVCEAWLQVEEHAAAAEEGRACSRCGHRAKKSQEGAKERHAMIRVGWLIHTRQTFVADNSLR